jgi:hypothetical protein
MAVQSWVVSGTMEPNTEAHGKMRTAMGASPMLLPMPGQEPWNGEPSYTYNGTEYAGEWVDRDATGCPDPADNWPDDPENGIDSDGDGLDNYDRAHRST